MFLSSQHTAPPSAIELELKQVKTNVELLSGRVEEAMRLFDSLKKSVNNNINTKTGSGTGKGTKPTTGASKGMEKGVEKKNQDIETQLVQKVDRATIKGIETKVSSQEEIIKSLSSKVKYCPPPPLSNFILIVSHLILFSFVSFLLFKKSTGRFVVGKHPKASGKLRHQLHQQWRRGRIQFHVNAIDDVIGYWHNHK